LLLTSFEYKRIEIGTIFFRNKNVCGAEEKNAKRYIREKKKGKLSLLLFTQPERISF